MPVLPILASEGERYKDIHGSSFADFAGVGRALIGDRAGVSEVALGSGEESKSGAFRKRQHAR